MPKLLIVDDNPFYRRRLAELFAEEGHTIETAATPAAALESVRRSQPDVLIVDRMLRDRVDGFEVSEWLQNINPRLKTILITGYPSASLERLLSESRVFGFLEKPFDPEELCDLVRDAIAAGQAQA